MKSIEEIIKESTPIEKVQTLISMIDTPMGQEKISQGYNPLGSILKRSSTPDTNKVMKRKPKTITTSSQSKSQRDTQNPN